MGGEFLEHNFHFDWCSFCNGFLQANSGGAARRPTQAQLAAMLPDLLDWSTWNYNALNPLSVVRFRQSVGDFHLANDRHAMAAWYQDDWRISQRVTLNLGVRWDADLGVMGEKKRLVPWMSGDAPASARLAAAARRLRVQPRRSDGGARRIRRLLHAAGERCRASVEPQHPDDHPGGRLRRPRRLPDEPVGRRVSVLRPGAAAALLVLADARLHSPRDHLRDPDDAARRHLQPSGAHRHGAAAGQRPGRSR